ncbi:MAG: glycosyltransferase [Labilithrix sp.]|nr:glycosyltransferase [Labilithrix sp.]
MRALYISHNGILEGLGRSQVLAYLRGLARRGVEFDLVSYELSTANDDEIAALRTELAGQGIRYHPLRRTLQTPLLTKLGESVQGVGKALRAALERRPAVVHGRSYLPTAVADLVATLVPKASLVFDCRGMLGDEYVDAGYWTPDRLEYRLLKRYESRAFRRSDGVVVLTNALRRWIDERRWFGQRTHVEAIPCCVDMDAFVFSERARVEVRRELGWDANATVLVYAGSLGSWYREDELARFAGIVRKRSSTPVRFLLLTAANPDELVSFLRREGFAGDTLKALRVRPEEMPRYLSAGDVGLSFIKSCFSKKGSSPTKVAEYLACGLPVILNGDIGDQAALAAEEQACVVVDSYADAELGRGADRLLALASAPLPDRVAGCRRVADEHFGLERVGVARYERLYRAITR